MIPEEQIKHSFTLSLFERSDCVLKEDATLEEKELKSNPATSAQASKEE